MNRPNITKPQLLEKINVILREFGLPLWNAANIGDAAAGQCEILDLLDFRELSPGRIRIKFLIAVHGRAATEISINFGRNLICVVPYLHVNQGDASDKSWWKIGLIKRWLAGDSEWTYELPRSIDPRPEGGDDDLDSPAHRVIAGILGAEFRDGLATDQLIKLGDFRMRGEYSRARAYLLRARIVQPGRRKIGDGEIVLMHPDRIVPHIRSGTFVSDALTAAVLFRALLRLEK